MRRFCGLIAHGPPAAVFDQIMLKMLRLWLNPNSAQAEGRYRNLSLPLPAGIIVAEQGLRHVHDEPGIHAVTAALDEAYVVMQLDNHRRWYATWQPYLGSWDLLYLDAVDEAAIEQTAANSRTAEALAQ